MELKQYFNIIKKKIWIVLLIPIAAVSASAYISFYVLEPIYEANMTLYVIGKKVEGQVPIAYNDLLAGQQLVKDYRELIKSRTVTRQVIEDLKLASLTPSDLARKISINLKNDTRIIEIKVEDPDPEMARKIADKTGEVFIAKAIELMKAENVSIVDRAEIPFSPVRPRPYTNMAIALFTGLLLALGIVFLLEYLDDTIKTKEDVEKYLGLPVLGTIPMLGMK